MVLDDMMRAELLSGMLLAFDGHHLYGKHRKISNDYGLLISLVHRTRRDFQDNSAVKSLLEKLRSKARKSEFERTQWRRSMQRGKVNSS